MYGIGVSASSESGVESSSSESRVESDCTDTQPERRPMTTKVVDNAEVNLTPQTLALSVVVLAVKTL